MGIEIERKFLVANSGWQREADGGTRIRQAYIANLTGASVRVRRTDSCAWLTIKGERRGIARPEFEYEIPVDEADVMLASLCQEPLIEKVRYRVSRNDLIWEIDVFEGRAAGLVIAEIELAQTDQTITLPDWIGEEVTYDLRYRNAAIACSGPPAATCQSLSQTPRAPAD